MLRLLAVVCGAVSAKCIYDALPPSVQVIAVWNASLCASVADGCFVNRSCAELPKPQHEYQAVGDYSDCKKMPFRINGADKPVDWTMFVAPRTTNLTNLILTHFPQVEFSPTFQWPQRLANLTISHIDNMTWPKSSQVPQLIELNIDKHAVPITSFPASVKSLSYTSSNLTSFPSELPPGLTSLVLDGNPITSVPPLPPTLTSLSIASTAITSLENLDFSNLTFLDISSTPLKTIKNVIFTSKMVTLNLTNVTLDNWSIDLGTFYFINRNDVPTLGASQSLANLPVTLVLDDFTCQDRASWDIPKAVCRTKFPNCTVCVGYDPNQKKKVWQLAFYFALDFLSGIAGDTYSTLTDDPDLDLKRLAIYRVQEKELQLEKLLGAGAFANVWLGTFCGDSVAVKTLQEHHVGLDHVQSFVDEIQLMGGFNSPSVVRLIGVAWTRPSDLKCIMEYMDCGDLRDYLVRNRPETFPWSDKLTHVYNIVEGLVYLHSLDIIHRDIKSRNILLDSTKGTKLTDFGISKEDIQATMTVGVGTFRWMAPEVIQSQNYTTAADIYSFGVVLSEFSTHHLPYEDLTNPSNGQPMGDTSIMVKVVAGELQPTFTSDCPEWIHDLARQCIALDPKDRPTAAQVAHRILSKLGRPSHTGVFV
ncbi:unnamed protein product [Aphanomyces euteiches]